MAAIDDHSGELGKHAALMLVPQAANPDAGATSGNMTLYCDEGDGLLHVKTPDGNDHILPTTPGDITGVTAGNGLTGGGTVGAVSLAADYGAGGDMAAAGVSNANAAGASTKLARVDHAHKWNAFFSTEQTGTGAPQNIAHGLGAAPKGVLISATAGHDGAGGAGDKMPTITEGAHDATNVVATVSQGAKFKVFAWT